MKFRIQPISQQYAQNITSWQYEDAYSMYNLSDLALQVLRDPDNRYYAVLDEFGQLSGYCCFGREARVPGGEYPETRQLVLDVGVGLHPEMVGRGSGHAFVDAILSFAKEEFNPESFRVSIAKFNKRSLKTFQKHGFVETNRFGRNSDGLRFIQLEREIIE